MIGDTVRNRLGRVRGARRLAASVRNGREFCATLVMVAITSITPQRLDGVVCAAAHRAFVTLRPDEVRKIAGRIERVNRQRDGEISPESVAEARGYWRTRIEVRYGEARGAGPRPWRPTVDVEGAEHVRRSLARGNGAVLWRMSFASAAVVNLGLLESGFEVIHLSSSSHRVTGQSWFARHVAAPLYTRPEARLVSTRIIRPGNGNLSYLKELTSNLEQNAVVTIVGDITRALHTETHMVGNMERRIPTGPPSIAYSTGATLHTCVALREGPNRYRLVIGPDIAEAREGAKRHARRAATTRFAAELEARLAESPESSMFWGRR